MVNRLQGNTLSAVGDLGLSTAKDKVVFTMAELGGNIWMMEPAEKLK